MRVSKGIVVLMSSIVLWGCTGHQKLAPKDYIHYVEDEDNGLVKTVTIGSINYIFQYKPVVYMVAQESGNSTNEQIKKRLSELSGTVWFNIKLENNTGNGSLLRSGVQSTAEYQARYDYFLNQASRDIKLVYKGQELKPSSYSFENNYNLTPVETIVVGFVLPDSAELNAELQISFFDRVFKNGIIKTVFSKSSIVNIPDCIL